MFKKIMLLAGLLGSVSLWGVEEGTLKIIVDENSALTAKVVDRADNVVISDTFNAETLTGLPEGSLALRIADRQHGLVWRPRWHDVGISGVRLPGFSLSKDGTVMAVVETTGAVNGPCGSRIVFFNALNGKVIRIANFDRMKLANICFLDRDGELMAAVMRKQSIFDQTHDLLVFIDTVKSDVVNTIHLPLGGNVNMLAVGKFLVVKPENGKDINIYEVTGRDSVIPREKVLWSTGNCPMAAWEDGQTIAVGGNSSVGVIDVTQAEVVNTLVLPERSEATAVSFAGSKSNIAVSLNNGNTLLYDNQIRKEFTKQGGGRLFFDAKSNLLMVQDQSGHTITPWSLKDLTIGKNIKPGGMTPKTMGYVAYYVMTAGDRMLLCSSFGDIMELNRTKSGWRKNLLLTAFR